jgi:hypothetical protein
VPRGGGRSDLQNHLCKSRLPPRVNFANHPFHLSWAIPWIKIEWLILKFPYFAWRGRFFTRYVLFALFHYVLYFLQGLISFHETIAASHTMRPFSRQIWYNSICDVQVDQFATANNPYDDARQDPSHIKLWCDSAGLNKCGLANTSCVRLISSASREINKFQHWYLTASLQQLY